MKHTLQSIITSNCTHTQSFWYWHSQRFSG